MAGLAGLYRGPDDYRKRFLEPFRGEFDDPRVEIHELLDAGDHVVASLTAKGRGRQSGVEVDWKVWQVWTVRDGKTIRGQGYGSKQEALEAVGLSE
jgi:ketosteroid isomerase-like protein